MSSQQISVQEALQQAKGRFKTLATNFDENQKDKDDNLFYTLIAFTAGLSEGAAKLKVFYQSAETNNAREAIEQEIGNVTAVIDVLVENNYDGYADDFHTKICSIQEALDAYERKNNG